MYRQILTNPNQNFLLWRENILLRCIELNTVTYGCNFLPFVATRTLQEIANKSQNAFPLASQAFRSQIYIDGIHSGANSEQELFALHYDLSSVLNKYNFRLHKWSSNNNC